MRSDMYKVIVERPRTGKTWDANAARRRDQFDGPMFLGIRAGYGRRGLNENLKPLKRYLHAQIGRPWSKVYGEISAGIDRRNAVQLHVFAHIDDMIAVDVEWRNGELIDLRNRHPWHHRPGLQLHQELYVDPRTGLIRPNKAYRSYGAERRVQRQLEIEQLATRFRHIDDDTRLMLIDGEWYEVRMADVPAAAGKAIGVYDVVLKRKLGARDDSQSDRQKLYGDCWRRDRYAKSKRQLSRREIERYALPRAAE